MPHEGSLRDLAESLCFSLIGREILEILSLRWRKLLHGSDNKALRLAADVTEPLWFAATAIGRLRRG